MSYPKTLNNDGTRGILEIIWDDNIVQRLDNAYLRNLCRCAECVSIRRKPGGKISCQESVKISEIHPVGNYAVQLAFSDGHNRGIFPWVYLRSLNV